MKLIIVMMTTFLMQLSASTLAQNITLKENNISLRQVFSQIRKQTGYTVLYESDLVKRNTAVGVDFEKTPLEQALRIILKDQNLNFEIKQKSIILTEKAVAPIKPVLDERIKKIDIKGKVVDEGGKPIPSVSILIKGTKKGTYTNEHGDFSISLANGEQEIIVSAIGFITQTITIGNQTSINVVLKEDKSKLNEVVVVGYGTQKKENLTGAVSTISSKDFEKRPIGNVSQALQGAAPGLVVTTNNRSGEPGSGLSFNIRGVGSINGGSPLVLVNGIEQDINQVNPNDIESVSVLKDAAASAIYGARAPYGVILVTTKKGKAGQFNVTYSNNITTTSPGRLPKPMNGPEFMDYYNTASLNDGGGLMFNKAMQDSARLFLQDPIKYPGIKKGNIWDPVTGWSNYFDGYASTNWFKEIYQNGNRQQHNLALSGGSDKIQYYISGGFYNEDGFMKRITPDNFSRYNINTSVSAQINSWLKMSSDNRLTTQKRTRSIEEPSLFFHNISRRWPVMAAKDLYGYWHADSDIPIAQSGVFTPQNLNLISQTSFTVTPVKHLDITSDFNFKWDFGKETAIQNLIKTYDANNSLMPRDPNSSYVYIGNSSNFYFTPNIYVNYDFVDFLPKDHHVKVLMGYQQEYNRYDDSYGKRNNLITAAVPALNTAIGDQQVGQSAYEWATQSIFARLNYDYQEKYLLELNGRRSGSSKFANGAKWGNFYGASLGWNMAKEDFFKNAINENLISLLKLRLSYGGLGNQNVGDNAYPYLATMGFSAKGEWLFNNALQPQIGAPGALPNRFTWERPVTKNMALDVVALKNRLSLTIEAFDRTTYDMLGPQNQLPLLVGVGAPRVNNATLSTRGFELSMGWNDKIGNDFSYNVRFLLADNQSKVLKYYNPTGTLASGYNEGRKIGEIWGYTSVGLFKDAAQVTDWLSKNDQSAISGSTWYPGDVMYKDLDGNGRVNNGKNTLSDHGDLSVIGNSNPRYQFSFNLGATWKNLSVSTFWQGIAKRDLAMGGAYFYGMFGDMWESAAFKEHLDYWTPTNTTAYYPRPTFDNNWRNELTQTRYLQNAAYLRLKNVTLNYSLPTSFLKKIHVSKLNVFVTGENLFTYTKLSKIFDPEVTYLWNWGEIYPLSKVYSIGVNINL